MSAVPLWRLRDVPGVLGSFTCGADGELLLSDMPDGFARPALESTAARLGNLFQSADEALEPSHLISLCFSGHQLHAHRYGGGLLCVLTGPDPDREELRLATSGVLSALES